MKDYNKETIEQRISFLDLLRSRTKNDFIFWEPFDLFINSYELNRVDFDDFFSTWLNDRGFSLEHDDSFFMTNNECYVFAICQTHKNLIEKRYTILISNEFHYPMVFADSYLYDNKEISNNLFGLFETIKTRYNYWLALDLGERGPLGTTVRRLLSE